MSVRITRSKTIHREPGYRYTADEQTEDESSSSNSSSHEYNDDEEPTSESSMESQTFDERDDEFLSSSSSSSSEEEEEKKRPRPVNRKLTYSECEDDEVEVLEPSVKKVKLTQPDIVEVLNVVS